MVNKGIELQKLRSKLLSSNVCSELASSATQLVFGEGSSEAEVMFVGEAPGKKEDQQGKPFVGASGKLLDELLFSIAMKREDVYITNIVKYRPPNNRDPLDSEKKDFWPYLLKQIAIIQPKIIVTLGRHSGQAFIPSLRISVDHGKPVGVKVIIEGQNKEIKILPLYHPAAALYNGSLKGTLVQDFKMIKKILI